MASTAAPPRGTVRETMRRLGTRARTITRSWFQPLQGPYTSALLVSDNGVPQWYGVTPQTAVAISAVYRGLAVYADLIGTLPVRRYRGDWELLAPPPFVDAPTGTPIGWTDEIGQAIWSLLLRGNAYLLPTSTDAAGFPATFYVADPDQVSVALTGDGLVEYRVRLSQWGINPGVDAVFVNPPPDQLLHIRWQTPPGALVGCGILDAAGGPFGSLAASSSTTRYAADLMANPTPPALLEHPQRLDKTQAEDLQAQWASSLGRARAVPAVLSGGVKYTPLSLTPQDVQLIEARKYNATDVATLFGLPPHMVGGDLGSSLTYSTVEGENTRLWTDALQPMAVRLQRAIGGAWTPRGQRLVFVPDAILRSQTLDRYNAHKIAIDTGFETVDEVRALENMPPLEIEADVEAELLPTATQQLPAMTPAALPASGGTSGGPE